MPKSNGTSDLPSNPNNCSTCDHKIGRREEDGFCYMFRHEPTDVCMQHTMRKKNDKELMMLLAKMVK
jgi:hypothetical protein